MDIKREKGKKGEVLVQGEAFENRAQTCYMRFPGDWEEEEDRLVRMYERLFTASTEKKKE